MTDISPQYLAGFFDGEGSITITVSGPGPNFLHVVKLFVTNTDKDILAAIQAQYGGRFQTRPSFKANWKPWCRIEWLGRRAIDLLDKIEPFLIIKTKQATLAREFWAFAQSPASERRESFMIECPGMKNGLRYERRKSEQALIKEKEFKDRMHYLNRKGPDIDELDEAA